MEPLDLALADLRNAGLLHTPQTGSQVCLPKLVGKASFFNDDKKSL